MAAADDEPDFTSAQAAMVATVTRPRCKPKSWHDSVVQSRAEDATRILRSAKREHERKRRHEALELDRCMLTLKEIALRCGYNCEGNALRAIQRAERELQRGCANDHEWAAREWRRMLGRNERLLRSAYLALVQLQRPRAPAEPALTLEERKDLPRLHRRVLELEAHRAKLIGLYAPERTEVSGPAGAPIAVHVEHEIAEVRTALFRVLASHPELRDELADALRPLAALPAPTADAHPDA